MQHYHPLLNSATEEELVANNSAFHTAVAMDLVNKLLDLVAPPIGFFTLLLFLPPFYLYKLLISTLNSIFCENMNNKDAVITSASSGIGEQLAYQYAKKRACLVLVARREDRLRRVAERARELGSPDVLVVPADVAKAEDCKHFIDEAVNHFGRCENCHLSLSL